VEYDDMTRKHSERKRANLGLAPDAPTQQESPEASKPNGHAKGPFDDILRQANAAGAAKDTQDQEEPKLTDVERAYADGVKAGVRLGAKLGNVIGHMDQADHDTEIVRRLERKLHRAGKRIARFKQAVHMAAIANMLTVKALDD